MFDMPTTFPHPFEDFGHPALDAPTRRADGRDRPTRQWHAGSRTRQRHAGSREVAPINRFGSMFRDMRSMFDRMERNFVSCDSCYSRGQRLVPECLIRLILD